MRTKHLLTMAAMTLGFAACTQEEIIDNVASNPMERPALDMTIEFPGASVDSRLVYDAAAFGWKWEAGDKFSAFMTDGATAWTVDDDLATNYIYSQGADGSYSTTSQMVEGMYWFFAPAKEEKLDRKLVSFNLSTNQTADYYKSEASQVYFSPVYQLEAKNNAANVVLKPTVYNLYSQAIFHIKNVSTSTSPTINILQIVLKKLNEGEDASNFVTKGEISPVKISKKSLYKYENGAFVQKANDGSRYYNESDLLNAEIVNKAAVNGEASSIVLNVNKTLQKNETLTATMLVPQAAADNYQVILVTDEGEITIQNTPVISGKNVYAPELTNVTFKHHGAKYVFGKLSNNAMKPIEITDGNITSVANSKYVGSAEDMVALINRSQGALQITKVGEWAIDENVIKAANNNANVLITFADHMDVENNSASEIEMNKFTFMSDWTLIKGAIKTSAHPANVKGGKLNYQGTGALVNNGGEITINSTAVTSVENNSGKVIFNANATLATLTNGNPSSYTTGEIVINAKKNVTVTGTMSNTHFDYNYVHYDSNIEINGTLTADALTNNGTIENNGVLTGGTNNGEITNAGEIVGVANEGYIEMTEFEGSASNISGAGIINNNVNGYVKSTGENIVYFEASGNNITEVSGATVMVVRDASIGSADVDVDVLFLGSTSVRTALETSKNVYVGCDNVAGDAYNKLTQHLVGAWNTTTNKYADYMAATKLTVYGDVKASEIWNYAAITNRGTVTGALKESNKWNGNANGVYTDMNAAISNATAGSIVILPAEGYTLSAPLTIDKNLTIKGGAISGKPVTVAAGAEVTFDGVTFKSVGDGNGDLSSVYYKTGSKKITIKNCTFEGFEWDAIQITDLTDAGEVEITGCTFKTPTAANALADGSYIHIANGTTQSAAKIKIVGNTFKTVGAMQDNPIKIYGVTTFSNITVGKNTVADAWNSAIPYVFVCHNVDKSGALGNRIEEFNKFIGNTEVTLNY